MGLTHTPESKVMAVWICRELPCLISSVLIYYTPETDIPVKSNDHLNFSRASVVHFRAPRYIMGLKHTPEPKVMVVRICRELPCSISSVSIYYAPELDIRVKSNDHLNFLRASVFHFRESWYIMGLTHTPESKVMVVWICQGLPCWILNASIYYAHELYIRVKSNDRLNFSRAYVVHFRAPRYIMGLKHTPESKVMAIRIFRELPCSISSVFIYYPPGMDIRLKSKDHLIFSRASVVHFCASWYIMGLKHIPE